MQNQKNVTLKELVSLYGEDAQLELSLYACGQTFSEPVTQDRLKCINKKGITTITINAEDN